MLAFYRAHSLKKMQLSYKTIHRQNAGRIRALCILSEMYNDMFIFPGSLKSASNYDVMATVLCFSGKYCKVPKFSDTKKLCCNLPKIQTKRPNLRVFCQNDAN